MDNVKKQTPVGWQLVPSQDLKSTGVCTLTKIPSTLDSLVNIQCLYMWQNRALKTISNSLGNLSQLKQLKLCGCVSLTSLPDTVGNLVQLKELCLGGCADLKSLPGTLGNLAQLEVLNLCGCTGLRILPSTIGGLAQLEVLNLHLCSGLERFPYTPGKLPKLRNLNLHQCSGLGSFHHIVAKLAQLRELNRRAALRSLVQEEFNVYLGSCATEVGGTLMAHLNKSLRICREDDQTGDIRRAIDSSDILVPVFSNANSRRWLREYKVMTSSNGLIIPFFSDDTPWLGVCDRDCDLFLAS